MALHKITCWSCQTSWEFTPPMARAESCEVCGWDARVCKNCRFYDSSAYQECREEQAELVKDKDRRNFCSWFESNATGLANSEKSKVNPLDQLFGSTPQVKSKTKLEEDLENFFGGSK